jgi:hypothetical protein
LFRSEVAELAPDLLVERVLERDVVASVPAGVAPVVSVV